MSVRSLNGLSGSNNIYVNTLSATLPLEIPDTNNTSSTISLKGLNGFGTAGQIIKVNSSGNGLEYSTDAGSNWTLNSTDLYPLSTDTNVSIGTTTNTNNKKLLVSGTAEITGVFTLGSTITKGSNTYTLPSATGTLALTSQIPDVSNFITASSADTLTNKSISYSQLTGTPTIPDVSNFITASSADTLTNKSISYSQLTGTPTIPTIPANVVASGKTGLTTFTKGDILYYNSGTTLSKLTIGTTGQVLKVSSGGIIEWVADSPNLTTATNFGTAATGVISLGNSAGTAVSSSLKLYGTSFNLYNTSSVNVATFTPVSNTCNLDLKGGELKTFTATTNAAWNGNAIGAIYGGTGLTTYTKGDMVYSSATNTLSKLTIGSTNQILSISSSGIPAWGTVPVSIYTTITEVPTTNLLLMLTTENTYKKVTVSNFVSLFQDTINYGGDLPIVKDATNDKYTFSISGLNASTSSEVNDTAIFIQGVSGVNTFKKTTGLQLQTYITNEGVNFGTNTTDTANKVFGNSVRDSVYNGKQVNIQSLGATKISILGNTITMAQTATDLRVGHSTDTNTMVGNETACCISTIKDLHLFTPTEDYAGTVNRISFIAGSSSSITAIMGYIGSDYSVASGGVPDPANSNNPHNACFVMTSGTQNMFAVCNRTGNFSTTKTQFTIKNDDINFWTENVIINGSVGQAVLKLNSSGGVLVGENGRSYVGRDTSTGFIYLGNAVDNSELFSALTYAKGIEFSRVLKGTKTDTSFSSNQAGLTAFPPIGQQLIQTSTSVGQGYLLNTIYRAPSSTEKYWSCFQIQLTGSHYILGWGTHTGSAGSGSFAQRFYIRSDGNFWGGSNLNTSDRRIKKDIINADGEECINILKSIKLKKYRYNDDWAEQHSIENSNYVYGFIAQDIGNSPELNYCWDNKTAPISIDNEDIFDINTIDKTKILSVLWGVCDKQQEEIEKQQTEIETLKSEIENIKSHLNL